MQSNGFQQRPHGTSQENRLIVLLSAACAVLLVLIALLLAVWLVRSRTGTVRAQILSQDSGSAKGGHSILSDVLANTCLRFAPTQGNLHRTAFIDPGHGNPDPGTDGQTTTGQIIYEKDIALVTALKLRELLRAEGYTVVMSRVSDTSVARPAPQDRDGSLMTAAGEHDELQARVACANAAQAQFSSRFTSTVSGPTTPSAARKRSMMMRGRLATRISSLPA